MGDVSFTFAGIEKNNFKFRGKTIDSLLTKNLRCAKLFNSNRYCGIKILTGSKQEEKEGATYGTHQ